MATRLENESQLFATASSMIHNNFTAIDLFAGAGGLSLGFEQAGYQIPLAVELDAWASETYASNRTNASILTADISEISDAFFSQFHGVDLVIGGPPCQGFSISASNRRNPLDPRNQMYQHFLRAVSVVKPRAILIENVKEISKAVLTSGESILQDISKTLENLNYQLCFGFLNAADFGVPQHRTRFFLVATQNNLPDLFLPGPYGGNLSLFGNGRAPLTLWDAISDLPEVNPGEHREDTILEYDKSISNDYQSMMRKGSVRLINHIPMRHTPRMIERFKLITIGENQEGVPDEHKPRRRGSPSDFSGILYGQNHRRLNPNKSAPTITASFYSSFIHPYEQRNLTVREAARIQSFPDTYRFCGKRTTLSKKLLEKKGLKEDMHLDQFNQVGNAVPPLLAEILARRIAEGLK